MAIWNELTETELRKEIERIEKELPTHFGSLRWPVMPKSLGLATLYELDGSPRFCHE